MSNVRIVFTGKEVECSSGRTEEQDSRDSHFRFVLVKRIICMCDNNGNRPQYLLTTDLAARAVSSSRKCVWSLSPNASSV
jgi:hypothetical protein